MCTRFCNPPPVDCRIFSLTLKPLQELASIHFIVHYPILDLATPALIATRSPLTTCKSDSALLLITLGTGSTQGSLKSHCSALSFRMADYGDLHLEFNNIIATIEYKRTNVTDIHNRIKLLAQHIYLLYLALCKLLSSYNFSENPEHEISGSRWYL